MYTDSPNNNNSKLANWDNNYYSHTASVQTEK